MADSDKTAEGGRTTDAPLPPTAPTATSTSTAPATTGTSSTVSDKDMIAGLNTRLKQSMNVIKTLKASEASLKANVSDYQQQIKTLEENEIKSAAAYKAKDLLLTHLQVTCDGLKDELRSSEKEGQVRTHANDTVLCPV